MCCLNQNRPLPQRALVVAAGVLANFALAWACYALPLATRGVPERTFAPGVVVTSVSDAGPGYRYTST
jgi:membrane-associated protease RseP (regulator of RpoE activity)